MIQRFGDKISDIKIVFPNKRPRFYLLDELGKILKYPFFPPLVYSIDEFVFEFYNKSFPDKRYCDNEEELIYYLYLSAEKLKKENVLNTEIVDSFEEFYYWGKILLNVVNEIEIFHCDLKKIDKYELYEDYVKKEVIKLLNNFSKIIDYFYEYLENEKLYFRGEAYRYVSKNLNNINERIVFCGFYALNKSEELIIKHFLDKDSILIIQSDITRWEDNVCSPFYFHYILKEKWNFKPKIICDDEIKETKINIFEASDLHSEIFAIKNINEENTAIVLPDSNALLPLIYRIKDLSVKEFNVTMGFPFDRTQIYSLFKRFTAIFINMKGDRIYIQDYIDFLKNPYIKRLKIENREFSEFVYSAEKTLVKYNQENGLTFASVYEIEDILKNENGKSWIYEKLKILNKEFINCFFDLKNLQNLSKNLIEVFKKIFNNDDYKDNIFLNQFLIQFFDKIENIAYSSIAEYVFKDCKKIWSLIDLVIKDIQVPFSGEPLVGLQVLGFLETRCLNFDNVYILDVNEGIIPENKKIDPILPYELRKILRLYDYKHTESIFAYNFFRLIEGAKNVSLIYTNSELAGYDNYRSRFIEKLIWENEKKGKKINIEKIVLPGIYKNKEDFSYRKNEDIMKILEGFKYTQSVLNNYLECPMKFLLKNVMKINALKKVEEELGGDKIGNFVHNILKEYFEEFKGKNIVIDNRRLLNLFEEKFEKFMHDFDKAKKGLLKESLSLRLKQMFEGMAKNEKIKRRKVFDLEREIEGFIDVDGKKIKLKGLIDRIDLDEDGKYIIIDYKTGSNIKIPKKRENLDKEKNNEKFYSRKEVLDALKTLQPSCYMYLLSIDRSIEIDDIGFEFVCFKETKIVDDDISDYLIDGLKFILSEILNPDVPFETTQKEDTCRNCDYTYFCGRKDKNY